MMLRTFCMLMLLASLDATSQNLAPRVLASSGTHYSSFSLNLSWTLGELAVNTLQQGAVTLTQGFHQPTKSAVGIQQFEGAGHVSVFPNPVSSELWVKTSSLSSFSLTLYNLHGQMVAREHFQETDLARMDVSRQVAGIYTLRISNAAGADVGIYKIQKTQ